MNLQNLDFTPLWITMKTGVAATFVSFFLGIFAARFVMGRKGKARAFWDGFLTMPLVLPPTVAGYILLRTFSTRRPFGRFLANAFPLMYRNARAAFEQVDENVIYAAQTLGLSERTIFWKIRIPMAKPGILSGTVLAFARAIGEYGATSMLAGNIAGRTSTISQQIAMVLQNGDFALAGFWCLVIFVISFVCLVALNLFGEKKSKGKKHVFHRKNKKTTGSL